MGEDQARFVISRCNLIVSLFGLCPSFRMVDANWSTHSLHHRNLAENDLLPDFELEMKVFRQTS